MVRRSGVSRGAPKSTTSMSPTTTSSAAGWSPNSFIGSEERSRNRTIFVRDFGVTDVVSSSRTTAAVNILARRTHHRAESRLARTCGRGQGRPLPRLPAANAIRSALHVDEVQALTARAGVVTWRSLNPLQRSSRILEHALFAGMPPLYWVCLLERQDVKRFAYLRLAPTPTTTRRSRACEFSAAGRGALGGALQEAASAAWEADARGRRLTGRSARPSRNSWPSSTRCANRPRPCACPS